MANKLILKRSSVAAKIPLASDLEVGEVAVNLADQKLYSKNAAGTVILIGQGASGSGDVVGPSSSTNNALARFDGATGKLIKNGAATLTDDGALGSLDSIAFDTTPESIPTAEGSLYWDTADGNKTLNLIMGGGLVTQQIGEETYYRIKASSAITDGQVVMFTGTVGNSGTLTGAPATGLTASTASHLIGIATESIALNGWGYITHFGLVRNINTTGGAEAWVDGQILYYNPAVAGALTKTPPNAPNAKAQVCAVVSAGTSGSLFVRPSFGGTLGQYEGDVQISSPASGQTLIYDAVDSRWENANLTAGTGISVTNGSGSVTITSTGVISLTGTTNEIDVSAASGAITISLPVTINANTTGNAATVTTNANLTGDVTSVGNATSIAAGVIVDADINASAAIADTKLATISTASKVSNSATTATSLNTASAIVARDASGNFVAGTITAALTGTASGNLVSGGALGTPSSGTLTNCSFPTLNQNTTGSSGSCTGNAATATTAGNLTGTPSISVASVTTSGTLIRPSPATGYMNGNYTTGESSLTSGCIYTIGGSYVPTTTTLGNMYGVGYGYSTVSGGSTGVGASLWGMYVASGGTTKVFLDSDNGNGFFTGYVKGTNITSGGNVTGSSASCTGNAATATTATTATTANATATANNFQMNSLGVGTAASGTAGTIRATNTITAYYSDDRLKTKLGGIENALDKVDALSGFYYEANDVAQSLGYDPIREVGVSAQQVQAVMPEIVAPAPIDERYLTVRYERMVPLLIEAIKELRAEINELKKEN